MKLNTKNLFILTCMGLFYVVSGFSSAFPEDSIVRAKIGIQIKSKDKNSMAKSRDRLKSGDLLRIYIYPEKISYIYVVYSDKKKASLLNIVKQKELNSSLVLPSVNEYYEIDGNSAFEMFTIICSPIELSQISNLVSYDDSYVKWASLKEDLIQKSKIVLTEKSAAPFAIAGNVRGDIKSETNDSFIKKLHIFSGKSFVVKQYEFKVKK